MKSIQYFQMTAAADYIVKEVAKFADDPSRYNVICQDPSNDEYKLTFKKEFFIFLAAYAIMFVYYNIMDPDFSLDNSEEISSKMPILFYMKYKEHILGAAIEFETRFAEFVSPEIQFYLKKISEYSQELKKAMRTINLPKVEKALDDEDELEAKIEANGKMFSVYRRYFLRTVNDACDEYCDIFHEGYAPFSSFALGDIYFNILEYVRENGQDPFHGK